MQIITSLILFLLLVYDVTFAQTDVMIFDVGQGGPGIIIKHARKALVIDFGSSEARGAAAYEKKHHSATPVTFTLQKVQQEASDSDASSSIFLPQTPSSSLVHPHNVGDSATSESSASPQRPSAVQRVVQRHKKTILEKAREALQHIDAITVLITHADADHYNLFPKLFSDDATRLKIKTVILSGFSDQYKQDFLDWVNKFSADTIIYSGTYDGHAKPQRPTTLQEWQRKDYYGRAFNSLVNTDMTPTEQKIVKALAFVGQDAPVVEILSMNAGITQIAGDRRYLANEHTNPGSIVLRIRSSKDDKCALLISGDAENPTWDHILASCIESYQAGRPTHYMIVSHHGSEENGATRKDILAFFKPAVAFISAGRHTGYHHPAREVIDLLEKEMQPDYETKPHYLNYFIQTPQQTPHQERPWRFVAVNTKRPIFSTFSNGLISFDLDESLETVQIEAQRKKEIIVTVAKGVTQFIVGTKCKIDDTTIFSTSRMPSRAVQGFRQKYSFLKKSNFWQYEGDAAHRTIKRIGQENHDEPNYLVAKGGKSGQYLYVYELMQLQKQ